MPWKRWMAVTLMGEGSPSTWPSHGLIEEEEEEEAGEAAAVVETDVTVMMIAMMTVTVIAIGAGGTTIDSMIATDWWHPRQNLIGCNFWLELGGTRNFNAPNPATECFRTVVG